MKKFFGFLFLVVLSPVILLMMLAGVAELVFSAPVIGTCIASFDGFMLVKVRPPSS